MKKKSLHEILLTKWYCKKTSSASDEVSLSLENSVSSWSLSSLISSSLSSSSSWKLFVTIKQRKPLRNSINLIEIDSHIMVDFVVWHRLPIPSMIIWTHCYDIVFIDFIFCCCSSCSCKIFSDKYMLRFIHFH